MFVWGDAGVEVWNGMGETRRCWRMRSWRSRERRWKGKKVVGTVDAPTSMSTGGSFKLELLGEEGSIMVDMTTVGGGE